MRAGQPGPAPATPRRAGRLAGPAAVSVLLHAAAFAALFAWAHPEPPPEPVAPEGVALVFADTDSLAGAPSEAPAAEQPMPAAPPAPPAPPMPAAEAAPPPPPVPPQPAAPPPPAVAAPPPPLVAALPAAPAGDVPLPPPADAPPPVEDTRVAAAPPEEPLPEPPPPPPEPAAEAPPIRMAQRQPPPRPQPPPRGGPVRLDAGIAALPDPRQGAQAMGAVVPPSAAGDNRNAPPEYPPESRRRGEEGVVRLALRIGPDGAVQAAEVAASSGHPALDRAAVEAVRRWRFRPATQGGLPVAAPLQTAIHFRLTEARGR